MAITFACPECNKTLRVGDALGRKHCKCPGCGATLAIPSVGGAEPPQLASPPVNSPALATNPLGPPPLPSEPSGESVVSAAPRASWQVFALAGSVALNTILLVVLIVLAFTT